jgi:predicted dehydrogenase
VRWTERRNMEEFLRLIALGAVTPARLTTHRFGIGEAERAYGVVRGDDREPFLGVLLTYPASRDARPVRTIRLRPRVPKEGRVGVGFIGAGNFARSILLPRFAGSPHARLVGVATATGVTARTTADRFGVGYCTTELDELLDDPDIDAVVIATRHGSHARFAAAALRAGKAVFVEKPLAIDEAGLRSVLAAQQESGRLLAVGFNRRFSPLVAAAREAFPFGAPISLTYRVNAGAIPPQVWVHDPEEGGGRIIGEVCHFVDFVQALVDADLDEVFAYSLGGPTGKLHDTVAIVLRYANGSIASINYFANGDRSFPKERVEVFGAGAVAVLDDFRELVLTRAGKRIRERRLSQDKGFDQEIAAFLDAVRSGGLPPIPLHSLVQTTRATFAVEESLRTGAPVRVRGG